MSFTSDWSEIEQESIEEYDEWQEDPDSYSADDWDPNPSERYIPEFTSEDEIWYDMSDEEFMQDHGLSEEEYKILEEDVTYLMEEEAPELWEGGDDEESGWAKTLKGLLGNKDLMSILAAAGLGALKGFKSEPTPRVKGGSGGSSGKPTPIISALAGQEMGAVQR